MMQAVKLEMARDSAVGHERILVVPGSLALDNSATNQHVTGAPKDLNQQILELKKEQEMQKQMLWHSFHEKNKQLEIQHKLQLEHKFQSAAISNGVFQELHEQRMAAATAAALEEQQQRERREREAIVRRKENSSSANASPEVKQKLQTFIISKKQNAATNGLASTSSPYRNWGVVKSSSGESIPAGIVSSSHPYKIPTQPPPTSLSKYDPDFPLRKTASEPNLLKIRLKQSVIERKARAGPLAARRQERLLAAQRRLNQQQGSLIGQNSGPNSPPTLTTSRGSPTSATIQEENEDPNYQAGRDSINDLSLYTSPSMPNISLGRPHLTNAHSHAYGIHPVLRTPSQTMLAPPGTPYYGTSLSLDHPEMPPQAHTTALHLAQLGLHQIPMYSHPITDAQVALARLHKQGHRPLGRTQSAPLPLGHPMLTGAAALNIAQTHYENSDAERQAYEQQHSLLTQKIRQTVLTRSGRIESFKEEECEEVIDLTDKKQPPKPMPTSTVVSSTLNSPPLISPEERLRDQEYLQQQRELLIRQSMQLSVDDQFMRNLSRPLSRTLSSPLVHPGQPNICGTRDTGQLDSQPPVNLTLPHRRNIIESEHKITTGLSYDNTMLKHSCICGNNNNHPEHSGRLQSVWARLGETGLASRCDRLRSRKATIDELQSVHSESHATVFGSNSNQLNRQKLEASGVNFVRLACGGIGVDMDTTWNEHYSSAAARMAAGCVIDLAFKTATGDVKNGFAVVRPPGHHAEHNQAMGFCFFNSIAIAAKLLRLRLPDVQKVLIVDWDVHHGNGTQQAFYEDNSVLYISIHRHDDGNFFPGTGGPTECGSGTGMGFNVNIAWSGGADQMFQSLGDAEYLAAFRTIIMPIAREFNPDIVLVSAGFDAAVGHPLPLGGYLLSPSCFGHLTRELMQLADGKVVLALEGGYDLTAICDSAQECVKALLGDELTPLNEAELTRTPCKNAIATLQKTIALQATHWPCVKRYSNSIGLSAIQAVKSEREESETLTAMAGLSMQPLTNRASISQDSSEEPMEQDDAK